MGPKVKEAINYGSLILGLSNWVVSDAIFWNGADLRGQKVEGEK